MQKILIIYNSGAGSTKTIVDVYSTLLSEYQVDILGVSLSFDFSVLNNYNLLVFAFPSYHCDVSPLMSDFMNKMPKQTRIKKAFVFITYGLYAGNTLRIFIKKCMEKNIYVADYADYRAPATDGSLMLPSVKFMYRYENKIAINIIKDIENIKRILSVDSFKNKLPRFKLYSLLNYPSQLMGKKHKPQIKVREDVCICCNLCVKQCPRECWAIGNSYPIFDKSKCDTCYKCIHQCPKQALIFSDKTIQKRKMNTQFYLKWKDKILSDIREISLD